MNGLVVNYIKGKVLMPPKPYLDLDKVKTKFPDITSLELFDVGGQKVVYKGAHNSFGKIMLKFFKTKKDDPRIEREIDIAKLLVHPNLPKLYKADTINFEDSDPSTKVVYLLEEYINGTTLRDHIDCNEIDLKECKMFLETMFSLLKVFQTNYVVHRDIKPENIMVKDGIFYLLDFGIARVLNNDSITNTSAIMGPHTLGYAPWEQINNEKELISEKTDLFSIAVICQEMIMKEHPFLISGTQSIVDMMNQTRDITLKNIDVESEVKQNLEEFLHTLMGKIPSSRPTLDESISWFSEFKERMQ